MSPTAAAPSAPTRGRLDGRRRGWLALPVLAALVGAGILAMGQVEYPRHRLTFTPAPGTWRGAFHVHTRLSDGLGSVEDVVRAARAAGLQWVAICDHNRIAPEGTRYVDGVLVLAAVETSTRWGHASTIGLRQPLGPDERKLPTALETIRARGGVPIASHPLGPRRPFKNLDAVELGGLEVISLDSLYRDTLRSPGRLALALFAWPLNPLHAVAMVLERPDRVLATWDEMLLRRAVSGFFAHDAHGRPAYEVVFRVMSTYVLPTSSPSGDATRDGALLEEALARGRSYLGVDAIAPAAGFAFIARSADGEIVGMGDAVAIGRRPVLEVDLMYDALPPQLRVEIRCGGHVVPTAGRPYEGGTRFTAAAPEPGACRVEVMHDGPVLQQPWILSNPIYIR